MKKKYSIVGLILFVAILVTLLFVLASRGNVAVLNPQGIIASKEKDLIIFTLLLSAVVVVPVFAMLFTFAFKYRAGAKKKAAYTPNWSHNTRLEAVWWGIPILIIAILSWVTWVSSHELDPYRPITSTTKPLKIQVIALEWKWLFIYPDQGVASVNLLELPTNTPIDFTITADAPMNSFWIPNLGSQVYAMSGMSTKLHLMADQPGDYRGSSANISGKGFADMNFTARAVSASVFDQWTQRIKADNHQLTAGVYADLAKPATSDLQFYTLADRRLYDTVIDKYMSMPMDDTAARHDSGGKME